MAEQTHINYEKNDVMRVRDTSLTAIEQFCSVYGLIPTIIDQDVAIPGSFWGEEEAGLIGNTLYLRNDTPLHSLLHEACHYICMSPARRTNLDTNAGGDYDEENAVCYLQILLAEQLPPLNPTQVMADMDSWGYSFRLGSAARWFYEDAEDARQWLLDNQLIDEHNTPTGRLR
jgi:hypothetical protein